MSPKITECRVVMRFAFKPTRLHLVGRSTGWTWLRHYLEFEKLDGDQWVSMHRWRTR